MSTEQLEASVTEDTLDASLKELVKAAGTVSAIDKLKKGGIVNSGFNNEDGEKGGGQATSSDAGGIETLMIGKLVANGFTGDSAQSLAGLMMGALTEAGLVGKASCENSDEGNDDDEMAGFARGYMAAMAKMGKSLDSQEVIEGKVEHTDNDAALYKSFTEDKDISEGVDASPFLSALTVKMTSSLETINKSINSQKNHQTTVNQASAAAIFQIGNLVKSQNGVIEALNKRLGLVEAQPVAPKGVRTEVQAKALQKGFGGNDGKKTQLTKSQTVSTLSYMNLEKGIKQVAGEATSKASMMIECGGTVSKSVYAEVEKFLAANPDEAKAATEYR